MEIVRLRVAWGDCAASDAVDSIISIAVVLTHTMLMERQMVCIINFQEDSPSGLRFRYAQACC
jgi:hypothetical protein